MNSNMDVYKGIPCILANQPIGDMYVCVLDSAFLQKITYADVRRNESECRNVERYVGVQRVLDPKREKEIGKYVNFVDATFPNSIIVNVSSDDANYDEKNKVLFIKDEESVASVLDGQHRIAGLKHLKDGSTFDCIVTVFIDLELEDQAIIFSTINTEQKKINKSLAADLAEFYNSRSPQRTCHNIARALRANEKSPFYGKISILGSAKKDEGESLTQYQFVKELLKHITKSPLEDRDVLKRKDLFISANDNSLWSELQKNYEDTIDIFSRRCESFMTPNVRNVVSYDRYDLRDLDNVALISNANLREALERASSSKRIIQDEEIEEIPPKKKSRKGKERE